MRVATSNSKRNIYKPDFMRILEVSTLATAVEKRDWALTFTGFDKLSYRGKGQRVGVVDTGCDIAHNDLKGQVEAVNFISGNLEVPSYRDQVGHGSFCVGEIVAKEDGRGVVGAAPQATAFAARVLYGSRKDATRRNVEGDIANAIRACVKEGCGVISMSLGGPGRSRVLESAVNDATAAGVILVAAAGNEKLEGSSYVSYPAGYANVISVAAADSAGLPAWFSTVGRGTDKLQQPEVAVGSLEFYWGCLPGNMYGRMIGTSQATPLVAAMALLWREAMLKKKKLPKGKDVLASFRAWLYKVSDDVNKNGWDPELGYGTLLLSDEEAGAL
jgi:subtilisin family serine protease